MTVDLFPSALPIILLSHMSSTLLPPRFVFGIYELKFLVVPVSKAIRRRHIDRGIAGTISALRSEFMASSRAEF